MFHQKLPNGKYRYYEKYFNESEGKWKQVSTTLNSKSRQAQAQAKQILADKIDAAQNTLFGFSENLTVSDVLPEWLELRKSEVKESTYVNQLFVVGRFQKVFGDHQLRKLTSVSIQRFLLSNKSLSPGYVKLLKSVISLFFKYCIKVGYLDDNPLNRVVLPRNRQTLEELQKKNKFLNQEEMKTYLTYLKEYGCNDMLNKVIELMYLTGMRAGEALVLTWDVVDLENRVIEIKQTLQHRGINGNFYLSSPKTVSGYRTVVLNARCVEILRSLETNETGFVFLTSRGVPVRLEILNNYLRRTFQRSGVDKSQLFKMTSHVLRHSHISLLVELNVPLRVIMDRVGHSDEKTTISIYTHVTKGMEEGLANVLDDLVI